MMTYETLSKLKIKTPNGIKIIPPGRIFYTSDIKIADSLVKSRKIKILSPNNNDHSVKQSPQSLQSPETPCQQGIADADIKEPKSAKSAGGDITTSRSRKNEASTNNKNHWSGEMQELIAWFRAAPRPTEPFYLAAHLKVINPANFFAALEREIEAGQESPRARTGALQSDLLSIRNYLGKRM